MNTYANIEGRWFIKGEGKAPSPGDQIVVKKKSGESKTETVERVVKEIEGKWIATFKQRRCLRYECGDCGEHVYSGTQCWETGLIH